MTEPHTWAACPQAEHISSPDIPKLFATEEQAKKFVKSFPPWPRSRLQERKRAIADLKVGKITRLPYQTMRKRRSESGWRCIPIRPIENGLIGKIQAFRDFIPPDQVGKVPEETLEDVVERAYENRFPNPLCFLAEEWDFVKIQDHAKRLPGHEFSGRLHRDVTDIALKALHDFDASLRFLHPDLTPISTADFYTSWQLWRHIAELCNRIGESAVAKQLAGNSGPARQLATAARSFLYIQLTSYAHQVKSIPPVILTLPEDQRRESINAAMPDLDAEVEREVEKQDQIRKQLQLKPVSNELLQAFLTGLVEQDALIIEAHANLIPKDQWSAIKDLFDRIRARVGSFPALGPNRKQTPVRAALRLAMATIHATIRELELENPDVFFQHTTKKERPTTGSESKVNRAKKTTANRKRQSSMIENPSAVEKIERYLAKIRNTQGINLTDFCARANNVSLRTLRNVRATNKGRPDTFKAIAEAMGTTFEDLMSQ
jgi:hypothetical protein